MAKGIRLRKLVRRDEVAAILAAVSGGEDAVVDVKGRHLAGPEVSGPGVEVTQPDGTALGSVTGPRATETAGALSALVGLEKERRELADEVLDRYREVNLLYALGEVLATAADRADLAARALREATRQVAVDAAYLIVDVPKPAAPAVAAAVGHLEPSTSIPADLATLRIETDGDGALLVAPLAFRGAQRGAIVLCRRSGTFEAADLKLTGAVASQCAGVLERILEEEARARAAAEREAALRRQLAQLRIELDAQRQAEQVGEVTETDYFGGLRAQASDLRRIIGDRPG